VKHSNRRTLIGFDEALAWLDYVGDHYLCKVEMRVRVGKYTPGRRLVALEYRALFPALGILEPIQVEVSVAVPTGEVGGMERAALDAAVSLCRTIEANPQCAFWAAAAESAKTDQS